MSDGRAYPVTDLKETMDERVKAEEGGILGEGYSWGRGKEQSVGRAPEEMLRNEHAGRKGGIASIRQER